MPPTTPLRKFCWTAERLALAGLLVFTLLVRGSALWAMRANLNQDPDAYREIAENLLRHGEFALGKPGPDDGVSRPIPTAYRPPLYPVVLSNLPAADGHRVSLAKVATLHLLLGVATVWMTWATDKRLLAASPGPPGLTLAPLLAGLLVACDPILLNQQALVMTETLAAFLAILSLWCLARFDGNRSWFNAALAGGAIGLAVLCRPTFLPWLGLVGVAMLVVRGRNSEFRIQNSENRDRRSEIGWLDNYGWRVANVAGLAIAATAVLSPWAIRNYRVFGKPIVTTTHGGYTLLLGNNKQFYHYLEHSNQSLPWSPSPPFPDYLEVSPSRDVEHALQYGQGPQAELNRDGACSAMANNDMRANPKGLISASLYRLRQLWSPLPHKLTADESTGRRLLRYATCLWYCGVYLLAAIGIWRISGGSVGTAHPTALLQPPWIRGLLLCLVFTAVHTFYWTNLRMRAPLMPFVALVAAAALHTSPKRERG